MDKEFDISSLLYRLLGGGQNGGLHLIEKLL